MNKKDSRRVTAIAFFIFLSVLTAQADPLIGFRESRQLANEGSRTVNLVIELKNNDLNKEILIDYETVGGSAKAGEDFFQTFGQIRADPGWGLIGFDIGLVDDRVMEPEERFTVVITAVSDGTIREDRSVITVVIQKDDGFSVVISDAQVIEGNEGTRDAVFKVMRRGNALPDAPLSYHTEVGTADPADGDFVHASGILHLTGQNPEGEIRVRVHGDRKVEPDETFRVILSDGTNAGIFLEDAEAIGTIITDDQPAFVSAASTVKLTVPTAETPTSWTTPEFDDSSWLSGPNAVGYDRAQDGDYMALIKFDVGDALASRLSSETSVFIRYPFEALAPEAYDSLNLRIKYDDGFVAFLNGERVLTKNAQLSSKWNSVATAQHDDSEAVLFETFDLTEDLPLLREGNNVLSIHGQNAAPTSSDFLIIAELLYTRAPNDGFLAWLGTHPGVPADMLGMHDDPDRDNLSNLVELSLGTSPVRFDLNPLAIEPELQGAEIDLVFSVIESPPIPLSFELQRCLGPDLNRWEVLARRSKQNLAWTGVGVAVQAVSDGTMQRVRLNVAPDIEHLCHFFRLVVKE